MHTRLFNDRNLAIKNGKDYYLEVHSKSGISGIYTEPKNSI